MDNNQYTKRMLWSIGLSILFVFFLHMSPLGYNLSCRKWGIVQLLFTDMILGISAAQMVNEVFDKKEKLK